MTAAKRSSSRSASSSAVGFRDAIDVLKRALKSCDESAPLRTLLGVAYARSHQVDSAFEQLERAVSLEPDGFTPECALGELYLRLGIVQKGRDHLARALEHAATREERAYVQQLLRQDRAPRAQAHPSPGLQQAVLGAIAVNDPVTRTVFASVVAVAVLLVVFFRAPLVPVAIGSLAAGGWVWWGERAVALIARARLRPRRPSAPG